MAYSPDTDRDMLVLGACHRRGYLCYTWLVGHCICIVCVAAVREKRDSTMSLDWMNYTTEPCYVCGRKLGSKTPQIAYLIDDSQRAVFVGSECVNKVLRAGSDGIVGQKGKGPRVFSSEQLAREAAASQSAKASQP